MLNKRNKFANLSSVTDRVRKVILNVFALFLIIAFFFFLALIHSDLGGFSTVPGAAVGVLTLILFLSPLIDRLIRAAYKLPQASWFAPAVGVLKLSRLAFSVVAAIGIVLYFLIDRSPSALKRALQNVLNALLP